MAVSSTFQLLGSYKVVDFESFAFVLRGFWAGEFNPRPETLDAKPSNLAVFMTFAEPKP